MEIVPIQGLKPEGSYKFPALVLSNPYFSELQTLGKSRKINSFGFVIFFKIFDLCNRVTHRMRS